MKNYYALVWGNVFVRDGLKVIGPLPPRLDLRRHSPTGLSWGYQGSGCAQLALALISDALGGPDSANDRRAVLVYQRFKEVAVATKNRDALFEMTEVEVLKVIRGIEAERAA